MKKIIITLAVVAMATISQAAVVKWGTGTNAVKFNGTVLGGQSVSLYMVGINGAADQLIDTRATTTAMFGKGTLALDAGSGQASLVYSSTVAGGALVTDAGTDAGRQYYMVINYTDGEGTKYSYTSSAVASSGLSATALGSVTFTVNDKIAESGKDAWVAATEKPDTPNVPEPTSGLLMLVGLGALALRRRRA